MVEIIGKILTFCQRALWCPLAFVFEGEFSTEGRGVRAN